MGSNEENIKICEYCGSTFLDPEADPAEECDCYEARVNRQRKERHKRYNDGIDRLFGLNCQEIEQSWRPVETEIQEALKVIAGYVAYDTIGAVSIKLADSSTCSITSAGVKRQLKLSREEK